MPRLIHATANRPGAIAIVQLIGEHGGILRSITGVDEWPTGKLRHVTFGDIDDGLVVRLTENIAQLMPHGGPRVLQKLIAKLIELGAEIADGSLVDPQQMYPESTDQFEALTMFAIARAHSPIAVDLLRDQPRRWREFTVRNLSLTLEDRARSQRLNRLIDPPIVVLAGRPNVGKSTLSNTLLGRTMSISHDLPGTTRDYTAGRVELAGLVVDWYDTPGIRETDDPVERKAIELSRRLIERADLLIAMSDAQNDWPSLPRAPDMHVMNKLDLPPSAGAARLEQPNIGRSAAAPTPMTVDVHISAVTGQNIAALVAAARDRLVPPSDLQHDGVWLFDRRLLPLDE